MRRQLRAGCADALKDPDLPVFLCHITSDTVFHSHACSSDTKLSAFQNYWKDQIKQCHTDSGNFLHESFDSLSRQRSTQLLNLTDHLKENGTTQTSPSHLPILVGFGAFTTICMALWILCSGGPGESLHAVGSQRSAECCRVWLPNKGILCSISSVARYVRHSANQPALAQSRVTTIRAS